MTLLDGITTYVDLKQAMGMRFRGAATILKAFQRQAGDVELAAVSPAPVADCLMISPRMYDSVKRFDPTLSVGAAVAVMPMEQATTTAAAHGNGVRSILIGRYLAG